MSGGFFVEMMNSGVRDRGEGKKFAWEVSSQLLNMLSNRQAYVKPYVLGDEEKPAFWE